MRALGKRILLYGAGTLLAGGGLYAAAWKPAPDPGTLAAGARWLLRAGLFEAASQQAVRALAVDPDHLESLLLEAACADARGDRRVALSLYERALPRTEDPDLRGEIGVAQALLRVDLGEEEGASEVLARLAPKESSVRGKVSYARAVLASREGRRADALALLGDARALASGEGDLLWTIGKQYRILGADERAREAFEASAAAGSRSGKYEWARLKFEEGEAEEGLHELRRLEASSASWLRRRMETERSFWDSFRARGDLPAGFLRAEEAGETRR